MLSAESGLVTRLAGPPVMRAKGINYQGHYRPDRVTDKELA